MSPSSADHRRSWLSSTRSKTHLIGNIDAVVNSVVPTRCVTKTNRVLATSLLTRLFLTRALTHRSHGPGHYERFGVSR